MSDSSSTSSMHKNIQNVSRFVLSCFTSLYLFLMSHPLHFFYLIFFSPYILKILSFLYPLLLTTSLIILALLTLSPGLFRGNYTCKRAKPESGTLLPTQCNVLVEFQPNEESQHNEKLEVYKYLFESTVFEEDQNPDSKIAEVGVKDNAAGETDEPVDKFLIYSGDCKDDNVDDDDDDDDALAGKLEEVVTFKTEEAKEVNPLGPESKKVVEQKEPLSKRESKALDNKTTTDAKANKSPGLEYRVLSRRNSGALGESPRTPENGGECFSDAIESFQAMSHLGSFGSMRKEKEWRRTLACKLFEERHNNTGGGGEAMDLLWERYENDSAEKQPVNEMRTPKKGSADGYKEDEDEDDVDEPLCCLQALKFSSGKMNLGLGRSNFLKISKTIKGMGWLHSASKNSRKGCR